MSQSLSYLDAHELAAVLGVSPSTVLRRLRARPWLLPAPAYLGPRYPTRWRRDNVNRWLLEMESHTPQKPVFAVPMVEEGMA